ncbi:hypothetical protein ON010_g8544 [Phytophthora cinnamomi]|nr:hypothetical protein ON010_g8544 [Phytophthora cinnamomi]
MQLIQSAASKYMGQDLDIEAAEESNTVTVRCVNSERQVVNEKAGRRVDFPGGEPLLFFHPFSEQEFNVILSRHDFNSSAEESDTHCVGTFLGWNIYHGAIIQGEEWMIDHVRCSKRIERSIDTMLHDMRREDGNSKCPVIPTSRDQGMDTEISIQTLQTFNEDST